MKTRILIVLVCGALLVSGCAAPPVVANTPAPSLTQAPTATPMLTAEPTPEVTSAPKFADMPLLGLKHVDITINLENMCHIPKADWSNSPVSELSGIREASSSVVRDNGDELTYRIWTDKNFNVCYVTFEAINFSGSKNFPELAANYLGYCATVPYDTAIPDAARAWIENNIDAALSEEVLEETFGGASYMLYGGEFIAVLEISATGFDDWLGDIF